MSTPSSRCQLLDFLATASPSGVPAGNQTYDENFRSPSWKRPVRVAFAARKPTTASPRQPQRTARRAGRHPGLEDEPKRVIAATVDGVRWCACTAPMARARFRQVPYKLAWFDALHRPGCRRTGAHPKLAVLGDYNVAPEDRDVPTPAWKVRAGIRARYASASVPVALGLKDSFRLFEQPEKTFSWWITA